MSTKQVSIQGQFWCTWQTKLELLARATLNLPLRTVPFLSLPMNQCIEMVLRYLSRLEQLRTYDNYGALFFLYGIQVS